VIPYAQPAPRKMWNRAIRLFAQWFHLSNRFNVDERSVATKD
jgi:hypothetical protein